MVSSDGFLFLFPCWCFSFVNLILGLLVYMIVVSSPLIIPFLIVGSLVLSLIDVTVWWLKFCLCNHVKVKPWILYECFLCWREIQKVYMCGLGKKSKWKIWGLWLKSHQGWARSMSVPWCLQFRLIYNICFFADC